MCIITASTEIDSNYEMPRNKVQAPIMTQDKLLSNLILDSRILK